MNLNLFYQIIIYFYICIYTIIMFINARSYSLKAYKLSSHVGINCLKSELWISDFLYLYFGVNVTYFSASIFDNYISVLYLKLVPSNRLVCVLLARFRFWIEINLAFDNLAHYCNLLSFKRSIMCKSIFNLNSITEINFIQRN